MHKRVLVIGGGIGGIQAALDLAQMGVTVVLVEERPAIGGRMAQLDKTFPTNDCSTCILSPKLAELSSHPNVDLYSYSTVEQTEKNEEGFQVRIRQKARFVSEEKCTACGLCSEKCPVRIPDEFNKGISETRCIGIPYAQAVPAVYRIDKEYCLYLTKGRCGLCKEVCSAGAVDYEQEDALVTLDFDAIIVAAGTEEFSPQIRPEYGYRIYPNVITNMEYERLLSASGPTEGHIRRPSDGVEPERIAFIQCVGSRDLAAGDRGYCSSYCCMQATKDAIITREHLNESDSTIFYIDIRAFGKDFDKFVERAEEEYGVRYVKSRIAEIGEDPETMNLNLHYVAQDGRIETDEFDLVVLSVGIAISDKVRKLLRDLGVQMGEHGFCQGSSFQPASTNVEGVYVCGTVTGPMDIPETVISASAAAAEAARGLLDTELESQHSLPVSHYPEERAMEGQNLNVGVVVCRCGVNIGSVVDVPSVVECARDMPNVRLAEEMIYACSQDSIKNMIAKIREHELTRFVVASCSPRTHETLFRNALEDAGLNKYLLQMTNIREQCSWVHRENPQRATEKAKDLVRMAVGKARFLQPLYGLESDVCKSCLVIGGGISGMTAALSIASNGFQVYLVEKDSHLGGNLRDLNYTLDTPDVPQVLQKLIEQVKEHPLIEVHTDAQIKSMEGYIGNFSTVLSLETEERTVKHGTVIIATGAKEHQTQSYGYQDEPYVVTQREFETMLLSGRRVRGKTRTQKRRHPVLERVDSIAMIQCVDSREDDHNYCSRVCCGQAMKNILRFKSEYPQKNVYVLYRDVRTYGLLEKHYTEARKAGALFIRYSRSRRPEIEKDENGEFIVKFYDEIIRKEISLSAQLIVLGVGIDALESNERLARMLKVPLNDDGFFLEAHVKLRPVDFATEGVFVCGLAHGPKYVRESVAQALAAAGRALTVITQDRIQAEASTAMVQRERCTGCGLCVEVCPYGAIEISSHSATREEATVNALLCKGCGSCAATCFSGAIDLSGFTNKQIIKEFEGLFV
ncbi:FAD-dependent oxidoreductase [Candidatus Poribacteria bacterium]